MSVDAGRMEAQRRLRRLRAIQAKFDAENQPITTETIPVVLENVVVPTRLKALAFEALESGELPMELP
jgi:hypothetical protein